MGTNKLKKKSLQYQTVCWKVSFEKWTSSIKFSFYAFIFVQILIKKCKKNFLANFREQQCQTNLASNVWLIKSSKPATWPTKNAVAPSHAPLLWRSRRGAQPGASKPNVLNSLSGFPTGNQSEKCTTQFKNTRPYHISCVQELSPPDYEKCLTYYK